MLLGLGVAGGLLPDPAALALLLAQLAQGKLMLGLGVVLLYSIGFAGVLVLVGAVAAKAGQRILDWMTGDWADRFRFGTAVLIAVVGAYLTMGAWRTLQAVGAS
jgi:nickel/cobalt transporter (NicO) family protein